MIDTKKISQEKKVYSPFAGKVVFLENVPDPVFNQKMMGDGLAVIPDPTEEIKVYSPVVGVVKVAFETAHAYTFKTSDDEHGILLHIGLDTVNLNGKGFTMETQVNQVVNPNNQICKISKKVSKEVPSMVSPILLVEDPDLKSGTVRVLVKEGQNVRKGQLLFIVE